jgi:4-diphosphocytidyl-2-C-methyl-D-erythritol kinase
MPTTLCSFSKINLGLAIGLIRADGFHSLTTLYQTLAAHDLVTVTAHPAAATHIVLASNDARVPTDEHNTAFKVVRLALEASSITAEIAIHIEKQLPVQGGMGAGSANAASALLALERELGAHGIAPLSGPEKLRIAAEIGSDVPLFLIGGAVLGVGRGEEVYPMPDLPATRCVVALPEIGVSTPQAFRDWDALYSAGSLERNAEREIRAPYASWNLEPAQLTHPPKSGTLKGLSRSLASAFCEPHSSGVFAVGEGLAEKTANSFAGINPLLALVRTGIENDFEEVVFPQNPLFGEIKRTLAASDTPELAAIYAALSGSGSALFGLYATEAAADAAEDRLAKLGVRSMRTETLPRDEYWRRVLA